jgi:cell division septation protein DedD
MPVEQQQTEVGERPVFAADADEEDEEKTVEIKLSWVRNAVAVAAAVVGFLVMTTPVSNSVDGSRSMGQLNSAVLQGMTVTDTNKQAVVIAHSRDTAAVAVTAKGEQADSLNAATAEPAAEEPAAEERDGYTIVLASYITKKNAKAYVEQLHKLGFADAEVFVRKNVTRVVFGHFSSESNAYNKLRTLRDHKEFEEAWVMKN